MGSTTVTSVKLGALDRAKLEAIRQHLGPTATRSDAIRTAIREKHDRLLLEQAETEIRRVG